MRLRRTLVAVGGALAAMLASGCGGDSAEPVSSPAGALPVVATTVQVGALAREVGGSHIALRVLIGPGVDPHDFELKVDSRKAIDAAKVILENGAGLDVVVESATHSGKNRAKVTVAAAGIQLRKAPESGSGGDPHVWHNPQNAKVMVDNIAEALAKADSANGGSYRANAEAYKATLDQADQQIKDLIATVPPDNRKMVTNHDAFGYFIEHYGLTYVGAVIPSLTTQAEPSAKQIAALSDLIRRERVRAIFAESSVDPKIASQIAKDTGVKIVDDLYGDSLGAPGTEAGTVHGMLLANARKIVEALR